MGSSHGYCPAERQYSGKSDDGAVRLATYLCLASMGYCREHRQRQRTGETEANHLLPSHERLCT